MQLPISKSNGKGKEPELNYYPILDYKVMSENTNLLLVQEGTMGVEEGAIEVNSDFLELHKIQFIAACKTELFQNLIVAFYIGEGNELYPYILSGLTGNYYQSGDNFMLIDYKSYLEICELTAETKLSLADYIKEKKTSSIGVNSLLIYRDKALNHNNQKELWKQIDNNKAATN